MRRFVRFAVSDSLSVAKSCASSFSQDRSPVMLHRCVFAAAGFGAKRLGAHLPQPCGWGRLLSVLV
jgi:hypothetical protein